MTEKKVTAAYIADYKEKSKARQEENKRLQESPECKAEMKLINANRPLACGINMALYLKHSSEDKRNVEAVDVLIDRLQKMLEDEPAFRASRDMTAAIKDLISSLDEIGIMTNYDIFIKAFATPFISSEASKKASFDRLKLEDGSSAKEAAKELFERWGQEPAKYKNKAAFKRDVVGSDYCLDLATAGRWLDDFIEELDSSSQLGKKLSKK